MPQVSATRSSPAAHRHVPPPFVCSWEIGGRDAAWLKVSGELDLTTSPQFRRRLLEASRSVRLVVLDLRELSFIDSSGIHAILDTARDAREHEGRLLIVRGPAPVDRVLSLTGVGKQVLIFDLAPTEPAPALRLLPPETTT